MPARTEVFRAESVASFIASAIQELMEGIVATKWQYAEFDEVFRQGSTHAALTLICKWPRLSMAILLELAQRGILDRLLARFDELAMERLFALLASRTDHDAEPLFVADLILTAKLALAHLPEKTVALRSRWYALSLFIRAHRTGQPLRSPRELFHTLLALASLLDEEVFWHNAPRSDSAAMRYPANVAALLESIARRVRESDAESLRHGRSPRPDVQSPFTELRTLLFALRTELKVPPPTPTPSEVRWISSDYCGLFFLTGVLVRLGWIAAWQQLPAFQPGGLTCLVAGLALAVVGKFDPALVTLDPGLALFAGYSDNPDLAHTRRVFLEFPREARLRVLHAAVKNGAHDDAAQDWQSTFDLLAEKLLREFAASVRGFRQAKRQAIVKSFIAQPGRIRVERERLVVVPSASPFHVALHVSGVDGAIESVSWLGRRLEFELGDL